jgi:hypothetical protein
MDLDPTISLAFTLEANPGAYALLLGAGISRGVVPTGWEIIETLVGRIAGVSGDTPERPIEWYQERFGEYPSYSRVLEVLSPASPGRVGVLRPFFEPGVTEGVDAEVAGPTAAHRAIARLVKAGLIKVVVTTNFDRLLERAFEDEGVHPTVLSTPSSMKGALPLHQQSACIIKIHGDYLDPSFLNTGDELATYDPEVDRILKRVMDDYGLVICGWSAEWDVALRHVIEERSNRRYPTYWVNPSRPTDNAESLVAHLDAIVASTSDIFFSVLQDTVKSLVAMAQRHPVSVALAVTSAKRCISTNDQVGLHDLLAREFENIVAQVGGHTTVTMPRPELDGVVSRIDGESATLLALVAIIARWGTEKENTFWVPRLVEMSEIPTASGSTASLNLFLYPATLILYIAGTAMLVAGRPKEVEQIIRRTVRNMFSGNLAPLSSELCAGRSLSCYGSDPEASQHVYDVIAPILREHLLLSDEAVRKAFEQLEILMMLVSIDASSDATLDVRYSSAGIIRRIGGMLSAEARPVVELERLRSGGVHPWISEGLFNGDGDRLNDCISQFNASFATRAMMPRGW